MIFSALNRCLLLAAGVGALVSCSEPVGLSGSSARYWQRCRSAGNTSWIGLRSLEDCDPEAAFACSPRRRLLNLSTEFRSVASAALLSRDLAEIALIG